MGTSKKVSVVIPTKNRSGLLERALESVYDQVERSVEIVIVDDGSTDDTPSAVEHHKMRSPFDIVYLRNESSCGAAAARNRGAEHASGRYIAFLDSDDRWMPSHLATRVRRLELLGADGVFGGFILLSKGQDIVKATPYDSQSHRLDEYMFCDGGETRTSTFVFRRNVFLDVQFNEKLEKHQDWDLALRFDSTHSFVFHREPTVIIHEAEGARMSAAMNHSATARFVHAHQDTMSPRARAGFYYLMAVGTLKREGRTKAFYDYLSRGRSLVPNGDRWLRLKIQLLRQTWFHFERAQHIFNGARSQLSSIVSRRPA